MPNANKSLAVVAVGGNAILRKNKKGTIAEQAANMGCYYCLDDKISFPSKAWAHSVLILGWRALF